MDLSTVPAAELIAELESRGEIKKIAVGPYQTHSLLEKYSPNHTELTGTVLFCAGQAQSECVRT